MDDYPSNSRRPPVAKGPLDSQPAQLPSAEDAPKLEKVVTGPVLRKKKSIGRRMRETFLGGTEGEGDGVLGYLAKQVIIPMVQDILVRVVTEGVEKAVFGQVVTPQRPHTRPGYRPTNYNRVSSTGSVTFSTPQNRQPATPPPAATSSANMDDIVLGTQIEAQVIADKMYETLQDYGAVSVANLKELLGETPKYTDHRWGWTDLRNLRIRRVHGGYAMQFPEPEDLS